MAGRFGLHSLLRLYAAERCAQEDDERDQAEAIGRLLDWHLQAADAAARCLYPTRLRLPVPPVAVTPPVLSFTSGAHALEWLDAERATLVALTRHAVGAGQRRTAWLLADTLRGYFWLRMYLADWLATAQVGLAAAQADADLPAQAAAQLSLGDVYQDHGDHQKAADSYRAALCHMREIGWLEGQASVLNNLGILHGRAGRLREAETCYAEAVAVNRQTGSVTGPVLNLINLGRVCHESGKPGRAAECETEALTLAREAGFAVGAAIAASSLGEFRHAQGHLGEALDLLTCAGGMLQETANRRAEADNLRLLAQVHSDLGRSDQALGMARAAHCLAREAGDSKGEADALNTLGVLLRHRGNCAGAAELHQQALDLACRAGIRHPETVALIGLAAAAGAVGARPGRAETVLDGAHHALALTREIGYRCLEGQALAALAGLDSSCGQVDQAIGRARQALTLLRDTGQRLHEAHCELLLGHLLSAGRPEAARSHWEHALALFTETGSPQVSFVRALLHQSPSAVQ